MKANTKLHKVLREYKSGTLRSSSGQRVTKLKQALAIGFSEQCRMQRK